MTEQIENPILELDEDQFPAFVAELWERHGWETERTSDDRGAGIDVVARKDGVTHLIRTEPHRDESAVTVGDIERGQELVDEAADVDEVTIVAPGQVTSAARSRASATDVDITDAVELDIMLQELGAEELPREFATSEIETEGTAAGGESEGEAEADAVSESVREIERDEARRAARELFIQGFLALVLAGTLVYLAIRLVEIF